MCDARFMSSDNTAGTNDRRLHAWLQRKTIFPTGDGAWVVELLDDGGANVSNLLMEQTPRNTDPRAEAQDLLEAGDYMSRGPWVEVGHDQWTMDVTHSN